MNETLGKRIAEHRKRLGLTQDALAEKLGITAQAISKWENDLSCPDIAMLPRLAEIFHISVDALLGRETPETIHEAEVIDDENEPSIHFENNKGSWNFHWNSGRRYSLVFAICVLWVGALALVARYLGWDASFWEIMWPSMLLIYGINGIFPRFSVFSFGIALVGGYYLLDNLSLWHWRVGSELIFPICVVLFGIGLLVDALRKPKKPRFRMHKGGNTQKTHSNSVNHSDSFACDLSFGELSHVVDAPCLSHGEANVSFGQLTVDLTQCESLSQACHVEANCSFGEIIFLVPSRFRVEAERNAAFGSLNFSGESDEIPKGILHLEANVSFGEISVRYI